MTSECPDSSRLVANPSLLGNPVSWSIPSQPPRNSRGLTYILKSFGFNRFDPGIFIRHQFTIVDYERARDDFWWGRGWTCHPWKLLIQTLHHFVIPQAAHCGSFQSVCEPKRYWIDLGDCSELKGKPDREGHPVPKSANPLMLQWDPADYCNQGQLDMVREIWRGIV